MLFVPLILFFGYVLWFCLKYGIPDSLSESWYKLPKNLKWLFPVILGFVSVFLLVIVLSTNGTFYSALFISIAVIGLIFVAIFSHFKDPFQKILHFFGAYLATLSILIWEFVMFKWDAIILIISIGGMVYFIYTLTKTPKIPKNTTFWLEMWIFCLFYISTIILNGIDKN